MLVLVYQAVNEPVGHAIEGLAIAWQPVVRLVNECQAVLYTQFDWMLWLVSCRLVVGYLLEVLCPP